MDVQGKLLPSYSSRPDIQPVDSTDCNESLGLD